MNIDQAYNQWAAQYDTNDNKTRDLEAIAIREMLGGQTYNRVLELGCGTGKNSVWLAKQCNELTSVDFSASMLEQAQSKLQNSHVRFIQADLLQHWNFAEGAYDLCTFSLVLEHIEDLSSIMGKVASVLTEGGYCYIGELHPFKQYSGSKARFETDKGTEVVTCFDHHVSDFISAAKNKGLVIDTLKEYFDEHEKTGLPRILALLLKKTG